MQTLQFPGSTQRVPRIEEHRREQAEELTLQLRDAAESAETFEQVIEQLAWLKPSQLERAHAMLRRHDYRSLGKLLCDVHTQLVDARLAQAAPRRVVLWDEVN